jgi:rhamnosyltransferase
MMDYLQGHKMDTRIKEIIVTENRGRDILPWLSIGEKLNVYDIVGHFHTKKSDSVEEWVGITWQKELLDLLLYPVTEIIEAFDANSKIGIIIPDVPYYFHFNSPLCFSQEKTMQAIMNTLWERMGCKKNIDFSKLMTAIMPTGNIFWYRTAALRPLFRLQLSVDDIPPEPLLVYDTILHVIERISVYIAWNEGYDYRIMVSENPCISAFVDNTLLNQQYAQKQEIINQQYLQNCHLRESITDEIKNSLTTVQGNLFFLYPRQ